MNTPVKDKDFDIVSTLYHASKGKQLCSQYADDAERSSDNEAKAFFDKVAQRYSEIAEDARSLLRDKL